MERLCGVTKSRTSPYHPETNGTVERMNRTLLQMLRTLPEHQKGRWHEKVNKMFAYNSTRHDTTGYSPHFLMFGREPRLNLDIILGLQNNDENYKGIPKSYTSYVKSWEEQMKEAFEIAHQKIATHKAADQQRWNKRPMLSALHTGDSLG